MKRLLAAGSGSIYCLGKAFRAGENGQRHHPEFTLLEWYRLDWDEHQLMDEVFALVLALGAVGGGAERYVYTYKQLFETCTGLEPHCGDISALRDLAGETANRDFSGEDRSTCLDLIFSLLIEPELPAGIVFVHDYPACQAALAATTRDGDGVIVARRFEGFCDGIELLNGYYELNDADELRKRFSEDNAQRRLLGKAEVAADEHLLAALDADFPPCAGVALGVDRLLMNLLGARDINEVLPFADFGPQPGNEP